HGVPRHAVPGNTVPGDAVPGDDRERGQVLGRQVEGLQVVVRLKAAVGVADVTLTFTSAVHIRVAGAATGNREWVRRAKKNTLQLPRTDPWMGLHVERGDTADDRSGDGGPAQLDVSAIYQMRRMVQRKSAAGRQGRDDVAAGGNEVRLAEPILRDAIARKTCQRVIRRR